MTLSDPVLLIELDLNSPNEWAARLHSIEGLRVEANATVSSRHLDFVQAGGCPCSTCFGTRLPMPPCSWNTIHWAWLVHAWFRL